MNRYYTLKDITRDLHARESARTRVKKQKAANAAAF
jgi:hypothetical protein